MSVDKPGISDEFKSRLERLSEDETIAVIVCGSNLYLPDDLLVDERKRIASEHYKRSTEPIFEYFEEHGIPVKGKTELLGMVYAELTRSQIHGLAEQPYVSGIMEDQQIHAI